MHNKTIYITTFGKLREQPKNDINRVEKRERTVIFRCTCMCVCVRERENVLQIKQ